MIHRLFGILSFCSFTTSSYFHVCTDFVCVQVIEDELGVPWRAVFSGLSPTPVAAASLGQVYRGTLAANGAEVAVKVHTGGFRASCITCCWIVLALVVFMLED